MGGGLHAPGKCQHLVYTMTCHGHGGEGTMEQGTVEATFRRYNHGYLSLTSKATIL